MSPYRCILADPPWPESGGGKIKRGADRHYTLIKTKEEILRVMLQSEFRVECVPSLGIPRHTKQAWMPDPEGCHIWLWVTNNYLPWGLWLMQALGFRYISNVAWVKAEQRESMFKPQKPGLGQYLRGQHELLLFGVMERLKAESKGVTAIVAPRRKHSQKPTEAYELIERVSPSPRVEFFARVAREGWDAFGNEIN